MKEGFDREIDSLLRRRARGTAELRSWGDGAGNGLTGAHLDADELGAFAEGALPPSARLAAASHLADCDSCCGIVVGLARVAGAGAAGVEVKQHAIAATGSNAPTRTPAWRALIMSLFAPRVMRFAVPVLALSLVGVVSYVALRSKSGASLEMTRDTGRQNTTTQSAPSAPAGSTASNANANASGLAEQNANAAPREAPVAGAQPNAPGRGHGGAEAAAPAEADADREAAQPSTAAPAPPPPAPVTVTAEGPADLSKAAPKAAPAEEGEVARDDSRYRSENKDKSTRASDAEDNVSNDAAVQRRAQSRVGEVQMPDGGARNNQKRSDNNVAGNYGVGNTGTATPPKESEGARAGTVRRDRPARPAEKKAEDNESGRDADTRTAAGHRFRRERGMWVDVNYKSSMRSTGVRRGTEPFRALVAEVPEVGRVAGAIDGEVIVVVGSRAYHIR